MEAKMNKIKSFFAAAWFAVVGVCVAPINVRASSEASAGTCAGKDAFIITIVSTVVILLEKVCEKVYRYCMARNDREHTSEIELDDTEQVDDGAIQGNRRTNGAINQTLL